MAIGMCTQNKRSFTVHDAMILIAASALALALVRDQVAVVLRLVQPGANGAQPLSVDELVANLPHLLQAASFLTPLAWGLFILRLRRPRPAVQALFQRPGFTATGVTCGISAVIWFGYLVVKAANGCFVQSVLLEREFLQDSSIVMIQSSLTAALIVIAWLRLVVRKRWCPDGSWVDRAGSVIGIAWFLQAALIVCDDFNRNYLATIILNFRTMVLSGC